MRNSLVVLLIAAASSCAGAVPLTACSAITHDQVQRALGRSVGKGVETNSQGQSTCDFRSNTGLVSLAIHTLDRQASPKAQEADLKAAFPDAVFQPTHVALSKGFAMLLPDSGVQLHLGAGSRKYLIVTIMGFGSTAETRSAAESILRTVLTKCRAAC